MKPNLFLRFFYQFFRVLANFSLWIYFGKNIIINRKGFDFEGSCIIVSNHPHALLDPLVSMSKCPHYSKFLANYGLFENPFMNWFLTTFYCIPIRRKKDNWGGPLKNEDSMDAAEDYLARGGVLYIAPEGTTFIKRRIRKIKTGTARIAFDAERENEWKLGLTILPVGNNFEAPTRFRGKVLVDVGKPIRVADFKEDFEKNNFDGIRKLTAAIGEKLSSLTIDIPTVEDERMIRYLEDILLTEAKTKGLHPKSSFGHSRELKNRNLSLPNYFQQRTNDNLKKDLSAEKLFFERKALAETVLKLKNENPKSFEKLKSTIFAYGNQLRAWCISDSVFQNSKISGLNILLLIISLPIFLWGYLNNFFLYHVLKLISNNPKLFIGYRATARILGGLFLFGPLFYGLQTWGIYRLTGNIWFALIYFLLLIPTGFFAWYWKENLKIIKRKSRFSKIKKAFPKKIIEQKNLRSELIKFSRQAFEFK